MPLAYCTWAWDSACAWRTPIPFSGRSATNVITPASRIAPAATGLSRNAVISSARKVNELTTRLVAPSAPPVACIVWLVIVSCSCPSRSRDCTSQEAPVKAWNRFVRSRACTSAAMRAGRIEIGICNRRRTTASANAIAIRVPTPAVRWRTPAWILSLCEEPTRWAAISAISASDPASANPANSELSASATTVPRRSPSSRFSREIVEAPEDASSRWWERSVTARSPGPCTGRTGHMGHTGHPGHTGHTGHDRHATAGQIDRVVPPAIHRGASGTREPVCDDARHEPQKRPDRDGQGRRGEPLDRQAR